MHVFELNEVFKHVEVEAILKDASDNAIWVAKTPTANDFFGSGFQGLERWGIRQGWLIPRPQLKIKAYLVLTLSCVLVSMLGMYSFNRAPHIL